MKYMARDWLARDEGSQHVEKMSDGGFPDIDDVGGRRSALQFLNFEDDEGLQWERLVVQLVETDYLEDVRRLLARMEKLPKQQASSSTISEWLEALFGMLARSRTAEIAWLLENADPTRLAPELFVGLLRAVSKLEPRPPSWDAFLGKAEQELARRGYDTASVLVGLRAKPANAAL